MKKTNQMFSCIDQICSTNDVTWTNFEFAAMLKGYFFTVSSINLSIWFQDSKLTKSMKENSTNLKQMSFLRIYLNFDKWDGLKSKNNWLDAFVCQYFVLLWQLFNLGTWHFIFGIECIQMEMHEAPPHLRFANSWTKKDLMKDPF